MTRERGGGREAHVARARCGRCQRWAGAGGGAMSAAMGWGAKGRKEAVKGQQYKPSAARRGVTPPRQLLALGAPGSHGKSRSAPVGDTSREPLVRKEASPSSPLPPPQRASTGCPAAGLAAATAVAEQPPAAAAARRRRRLQRQIREDRATGVVPWRQALGASTNVNRACTGGGRGLA
eukprot:363414-Chlamydomonas_euryale.AAC.8